MYSTEILEHAMICLTSVAFLRMPRRHSGDPKVKWVVQLHIRGHPSPPLKSSKRQFLRRIGPRTGPSIEPLLSALSERVSSTSCLKMDFGNQHVSEVAGILVLARFLCLFFFLSSSIMIRGLGRAEGLWLWLFFSLIREAGYWKDPVPSEWCI
jgi:hypothetical protein